MRRFLPLSFLILGLFGSVILTIPFQRWLVRAQVPQSVTYYVNCTRGDDNASGTSPAEAWRTINRANNAVLRPGDRLLLRRGCVWEGQQLRARWNGTATAPVIISAYGTGDLPRLHNGPNRNVDITGSYQIIEYLASSNDVTQYFVDEHCPAPGQPLGWHIGFDFRDQAANNTLQFVRAANHTAGARIGRDANNNRILYSTFLGNRLMNRFDRNNPALDLGAWGVLVNGNSNLIAYNTFRDNNAVCRSGVLPTEKIHGNSVEVYAAQGNRILYNTVFNDRVFSELGSASWRIAADNVYAYNLFFSNREDARFLVTRGAADTVYGPVLGTVVLNNTIYSTHPESKGVICGAGCSADVLTMHNNVIWAEEKVLFADAPFNESNNIFWREDGNPFVDIRGFTIHATSMIANPSFVNRSSGNFRLRTGSPAIDAGAAAPLDWNLTVDLSNVPIPQNRVVDIGAYEFDPGFSSPTQIPLPSPTRTPAPSPPPAASTVTPPPAPATSTPPFATPPVIPDVVPTEESWSVFLPLIQR